MTVEEMKELKCRYGYSYAMISEKSGVPLGTVQKVFGGETQSPRYDTLQALEKVFDTGGDMHLHEAEAVYSADRQGSYTLKDYYELPDERRVELIDGVFYDMAAPTYTHQFIVGEIHRQIANYIMDRHGACQVGLSPLDVQLDCDEKTMVQPDVVIMCDDEKIVDGRVYGAPDFVLEVLSPSTKQKDCSVKLTKYIQAGVREYWIIDPVRKKLLVYFFEREVYPNIYGFDNPVPISIYEGKLEIKFDNITKRLEGSKI